MARGESKFADEEDERGGDVAESKFGAEEESKFAGDGKGDEEGKEAEGVSLMLRATNYCFSREFIGVFENFIEEHAYIFFDTVDSGEEEHKLEYHDLFKDYLVLYESTMEKWLEREGFTLEEFNRCLSEAKEAGKISEKYFIKLLVASGEYDCFYDVMIKEAERQRNGEEAN